MRSIRSASPGVSFSLDQDTLSDEAPATIFFSRRQELYPFASLLAFRFRVMTRLKVHGMS